MYAAQGPVRASQTLSRCLDVPSPWTWRKEGSDRGDQMDDRIVGTEAECGLGLPGTSSLGA